MSFKGIDVYQMYVKNTVSNYGSTKFKYSWPRGQEFKDLNLQNHEL